MGKPKVEIRKATEIGFCSGVSEAIEVVERAVCQRGALESLGGICHNRQVVERLATRGVVAVESLDEVKGPTVVITSHGVGPQVVERMRARGLEIIDTTCPFVRSAQKAAKRLADGGFFVVIFGDAQHSEVQGVLDWAGGRGVASLEGEFLSRLGKLPRRIAILSQTTQSPARFAHFVNKVMDHRLSEMREIRIVNTICDDTKKRQAAALELAKEAEMMVVIGGRDSANTRRLAEICEAARVETHHIETAQEVDRAWLANRRQIGVVGGASTPSETIDEVITKLRELADD